LCVRCKYLLLCFEINTKLLEEKGSFIFHLVWVLQQTRQPFCDWTRFWHVRFEVLMVINMMIYTWDVTPCSWVDRPRSQHIRGNWWPAECWYQSTKMHGFISQKGVIFKIWARSVDISNAYINPLHALV